MVDLSVIIRSKNEAAYIGHAIQSVLDFVPNPEIIIIDNDSSDNTLEVARLFQHDTDLQASSNYCTIKIANISSYSPGRALNMGIQMASCKFYMILSAHCVLTSFNFHSLVPHFNVYKCIFGNQIPCYMGKKITKRYIWSHFVDHDVPNMYSQLEDRYFMHNALSMFDTKFLQEYPFDEQLVGKEDRYWANNIVKQNYSYLYTPSFEALHHYTANGNTWKGIG